MWRTMKQLYNSIEVKLRAVMGEIWLSQLTYLDPTCNEDREQETEQKKTQLKIW